MTKIDKNEQKGLTQEKKMMFKSIIGKASSPKQHPNFKITQEEMDEIEKNSIEAIKFLIENEILLILDSNKESAVQQLKLYKELGAADAVNVSIVNEYGISLLTVDNRLINNIEKNIDKLENIHNLYYTTPAYKTY